MRRGAKAHHVSTLREMAISLRAQADKVEVAEDEPFRWSVGWGPSFVALAERRISASEAEDIVAGGIWAMFESIRDGSDASDPKAFERVMQRVTELAEDRCHQRRSAKDQPKGIK